MEFEEQPIYYQGGRESYYLVELNEIIGETIACKYL
jgi:hypothetical protein